MEIIKCDKCKKILRAGKKDNSIKKTRGNISSNISNDWLFLSFDLREKCSTKLIKFTREYLAN